jgi:DNA-binding transcriptional LysR family regulator
MRSAFPEVTPCLLSGAPNELINAILASDLEFGLFFTKINVPGIRYESLFSMPMAVVCHPRRVPTGTREITMPKLRKILLDSGFIGSIKSQYTSHPAQELLRLTGKDLPICFESNSQEVQKRYCLAGDGVAYLARFMVDKELNDGSLIEIPLKNPPALSLLVARKAERDLTLTAKTFLGRFKRRWES